MYGAKEAKLNYGLPDYLITKDCEKFIADAKYKPLYNIDGKYDIDNIRQLSGYARDEKVFEKLRIEKNVIIDCVLIHPIPHNKKSKEKFIIDLKQSKELSSFVNFKRLEFQFR